MSVSQQINAISVNSLNIILQSVKTLLNAKFALKTTTSDCITAFCALKKRKMHVFTLY